MSMHLERRLARPRGYPEIVARQKTQKRVGLLFQRSLLASRDGPTPCFAFGRSRSERCSPNERIRFHYPIDIFWARVFHRNCMGTVWSPTCSLAFLASRACQKFRGLALAGMFRRCHIGARNNRRSTSNVGRSCLGTVRSCEISHRNTWGYRLQRIDLRIRNL